MNHRSMANLVRTALLFAAVFIANVAAAKDNVVSSPDGSTAIRIAADASTFSITRHGETVIASSPLGLEFDAVPAWGRLAFDSREDVSVDQVISLIATKAATARDHYKGATFKFRDTASASRALLIDVRAYNDGVAFRYRIEGGAPVQVLGERTGFSLAGDPTCIVTPVHEAHEMTFDQVKFSELQADKKYDVPFVCATQSGRTHFAITQADLEGYTGAYLSKKGPSLQVQLFAVPKRTGAAVQTQSGLTSAWRVVMMGDRVGDMIASHLIGNLNPAPAGDFSWVKPGKAAWDWWSGPLEGVKPSMSTYRRFIDFAAASGFPYYLIDAGWSWGAGPCCEALPTNDVTRAAEGIDMRELVRYAADKNVGLILWVHWAHLYPRIEEVLDTYTRWGIKGIKVDFMNRDDQEMVEFYTRMAAETAERRMLLDLHGAYVPAGLQRTYPNFITQEGVLGAEWNKMDRRVTPRHNLMLPYTRMLAGPMDYTPGGFRHRTPATFEVNAVMPLTQTSRGQALAMYVIYDSPLQMVSDDPDAYTNAAGFEFIRRVPTAWDETRFLSGEPGRHIVLARRAGDMWYIGAMTADQAGNQQVPLSFLGSGKYRATIWQDGASMDSVTRSERVVTSGDVLSLRLSAAGGAVVVIER